MTNLTRIIMASGAGQADPGQVEYTSAGTYDWECPAGVFSVSILAVGCGGPGGGGNLGGAGTGYKNNYSVTPGNTYTVVVGNHSNGDTYFVSTAVVKGGGPGSPNRFSGGNHTGHGGGDGGDVPQGSNDYNGGGGGAGGYSGDGGNGASRDVSGGPHTGSAGSGGGGGGGGNNRGGGGIGLEGEGSSGGSAGPNVDGLPGSGGVGPLYGAGGSQGGSVATNGALRIIWPGDERQYPSTRTADE